jgi:hypothetical protein
MRGAEGGGSGGAEIGYIGGACARQVKVKILEHHHTMGHPVRGHPQSVQAQIISLFISRSTRRNKSSKRKERQRRCGGTNLDDVVQRVGK